ncbi:MAG: sulfite exporter TauE/SafE family protein [Cryobacterium sp.]|uniref:sulfite exporter TauE/SafE family protein n=1 Tax=unclassified Cryobacterium TaxID=2649013 RepID=UPI0018CBC58D|nr:MULTISPECIES: sulfite exporter TauE/SafE family protein [unclassified Cryobacterium]MCY7403269.1 sulfite exporter TauE/SafE family protein [Cryobacterium sp.]MEC5153667.1 putative membrane protein YfcA [Cryobacterium sp. CAN_C3]
MWTTVLVIAAVLIGSSMQRITGMGFALVAAPFLVLLLGPIDGVIVVNVCGALTAGVILMRVFRHVDWRRYGILAVCAVLGIIPGSYVLQFVSVAWLEISIGVLVAAGLTISVSLGRVVVRDRLSFLMMAGVTSGLMNTTAGVGGPAVSIYAIATGWPQRSFAATMQPYFLTIGLASLTSKFALGSAEVPQLPNLVWVLIGCACLVGLIAGDLLTTVIEPHVARRLLVIVAYLGSFATIVRGVLELFA